MTAPAINYPTREERIKHGIFSRRHQTSAAHIERSAHNRATWGKRGRIARARERCAERGHQTTREARMGTAPPAKGERCHNCGGIVSLARAA